jgi:predicted metal-dependent phosphotriesterase family hydrolase
MLGHDYAPRPVIAGEEAVMDAQTTYLFLSRTAIPALKADGVTEEVIQAMLVDTPRHFLSGD